MLRYRLPTVLQQLQSARSCPATQVRTMHASAHAYAMPALRCSMAASHRSIAAATSSSSSAPHSCPCCCGIRSASKAIPSIINAHSVRAFSSKAKSHSGGGGGTVASRQAKSSARTLTRLGFNPLNYRVAIFGRPNVGKSTLFNRLVGRSLAIVDSNPGVTRDRREADATLGELEFKLVDTAGLEEVQQFLRAVGVGGKDSEELNAQDGEYRLVDREPMSRSLQQSIITQTALAISECDVAIFVIDGRTGVTPLDQFFARWLRRQCSSTLRVVDPETGVVSHRTVKKPVVLVANKCDNSEQAGSYHGLTEGWELGFNEPLPVSADHASGLSSLHNALYEAFLQVHSAKQAEFKQREARINAEVAILPQLRQIRLAIVGKVNTGKSTLLNTLIGTPRALTGEQPGVTRDPVEVEWRDQEEEAKEEAKAIKDMQEEQERENPTIQPSGKERRELREAAAEAASATGGGDGIALLPPAAGAAVVSPLVPSYRFTLVDTAGLKGVTAHAHSRYSKVDSMAMGMTLKTIDKANMVALVIDITDANIEGVGETTAAPTATEKDTGKDKKKVSKKKTPSPSSSSSSASDSSSAAIPLSSMLFKPDRRYSETERGFLLRTFVRNVFTAGDLAIASKVLKEGRGLLILLNKFDLVPPGPLRSQILEGVALELNSLLSEGGGSGLTVLGISGASPYDTMRGQPLKTTIRSGVIQVFEKWSVRIATHRLNRWLIELLKFHPPPPTREGASGTLRKTSLKFMQQVATGPPSFVIFANTAGESLPETYRAFLTKSLRDQFGLQGVPIRLFVRARKNPYLDPQTKQDARAKQQKNEAAIEGAVPSFAEGKTANEAAEEDDDDGEEFDESNYGKEIRFDYDAETSTSSSPSSSSEVQSEEAREERRREEVQQLMAIRARKQTDVPAPATTAPSAASIKAPLRNLDAPIPRVTPVSASQRGAILPRVNTSSIFASTRTVAGKPGRNLGVNASSKWSLDRPRLPGAKRTTGKGGAPTWSAFPTKKQMKPFGTKQPKKKAATSSVLQKTIDKANEHNERKKSAQKARKAANKSRQQTQKR